MDFSHIDKQGKASMVDVSLKPKIRRTALAEGKVWTDPETVVRIKEKLLKKGDALTIAEIAGIQGGKAASSLIPLCHPIGIDRLDVTCNLEDDGVRIQGEAVCTDKTGIEMEALTAVSVACLTIYDMCKAVDKNMRIGDIRLLKKTKESLAERDGNPPGKS